MIQVSLALSPRDQAVQTVEVILANRRFCPRPLVFPMSWDMFGNQCKIGDEDCSISHLSLHHKGLVSKYHVLGKIHQFQKTAHKARILWLRENTL